MFIGFLCFCPVSRATTCWKGESRSWERIEILKSHEASLFSSSSSSSSPFSRFLLATPLEIPFSVVVFAVVRPCGLVFTASLQQSRQKTVWTRINQATIWWKTRHSLVLFFRVDVLKMPLSKHFPEKRFLKKESISPVNPERELNQMSERYRNQLPDKTLTLSWQWMALALSHQLFLCKNPLSQRLTRSSCSIEAALCCRCSSALLAASDSNTYNISANYF